MKHQKPHDHTYTAFLEWTGNSGEGTRDYGAYGREYRIGFDGKPIIAGSSDPTFRGRPDLHNPEDLFVASVAACHMLFWLSLCAGNGIRALSYEDRPTGVLELEPGGGGRFREIVLRPVARIANGDDAELALRLHEKAHERCFIAASCRIPIRHEPEVRTAATGSGDRPGPLAEMGEAPAGRHSVGNEEAMTDLAIELDDRPGALAELGEALGRASVSIEGGGAFVTGGKGVAHFLFRDGQSARRALEAAGIRVASERAVVAQRLRQETSGQLGLLTRRMADAGVNIEVLYSDHDHRLILVVDDEQAAQAVSAAWWTSQTDR